MILLGINSFYKTVLIEDKKIIRMGMAKLEQELLNKLIRMTSEHARIDAKTFGSYIVYKDRGDAL